MAIILDKQYRILPKGGHELDFQAWRTEKLADGSYEYHAFVTHNYTDTDGYKGAAWMIIRITDPNEINSIQEYSMGRTGLPGSGSDSFTDAWTNRATIDYFRYDQMLTEFFS